MGSASSGSSPVKMGGGSGMRNKTKYTSSPVKMGAGQGYKNAPKKSRSTGSQVGRGAAIAGAAAYGAGVYKQSKNPATGIISGRTRGANVPGRTQRAAYNTAIKGGKTPAQAMAMAKAAKVGKATLAAGKFLTKKTVIGTAALYAGEKLVSKAIKDSKKPKAGPGISRRKPTGGKGY
jgi:hypothetical protein